MACKRVADLGLEEDCFGVAPPSGAGAIRRAWSKRGWCEPLGFVASKTARGSGKILDFKHYNTFEKKIALGPGLATIFWNNFCATFWKP